MYTLNTACGLTELLFLSSAIQFIVEGLFVLFIITIAKSTPCSVRTRSLYTGNFFISFMIHSSCVAMLFIAGSGMALVRVRVVGVAESFPAVWLSRQFLAARSRWPSKEMQMNLLTCTTVYRTKKADFTTIRRLFWTITKNKRLQQFGKETCSEPT